VESDDLKFTSGTSGLSLDCSNWKTKVDFQANWTITSPVATLCQNDGAIQFQTDKWSIDVVGDSTWTHFGENSEKFSVVRDGTLRFETESWQIQSSDFSWRISAPDAKMTIEPATVRIDTPNWTITNHYINHTTEQQKSSLYNNHTPEKQKFIPVTTAVASGDLSKKIIAYVKEEILELKNTIQHVPESHVAVDRVPAHHVVSKDKQTGNPKCHHCGKTVYHLELVAAIELFWHKTCFRCESEGCGVVLHLNSFESHGGKIYCHKHAPKEKRISTAVNGDLVTMAAVTAPKLRRQTGVKKDTRTSFGPLNHVDDE